MQTFLPLPTFTGSLDCLDYRRLGKQRVEVLQLLKALAGQSKGWTTHPCTTMWRGHERALATYGLVACTIWKAKGYRDTCTEKIRELSELFPEESGLRPSWMGYEAFHASHRAALLYKDPDHYGAFGWTETPAMDYVWPTPAALTVTTKTLG